MKINDASKKTVDATNASTQARSGKAVAKSETATVASDKVRISAQSQAFAGEVGASGAERLYGPLRETVVGQGRVTALHSVHRDAGGVRFAPVADSADGLGTPLDPARPQWAAFGHAGLAPAPLGFALASPVLRMQEGRRAVSIILDLAFVEAAGLDGQDIADGLQAFVTGDKGWLGPYALTGALSGGRLTLGFAVPDGEPAVVDYAVAVHGHAFACALPVVQLLLRPEAAGDYAALAKLRVDQAGLSVAVDGLKTLNLENDFGALNPKKAFQPFGPQPVKGSRFMKMDQVVAALLAGGAHAA